MTRRPTTFPNHQATSALPLTSAHFHILLVLAEGERHGYRIMQEVERRTGGATELGPGTLYRSIKQLLARALIREVEAGPGGEASGDRRRTYALTREGRRCALAEGRRVQSLARWAKEALVMEGGRP